MQPTTSQQQAQSSAACRRGQIPALLPGVVTAAGAERGKRAGCRGDRGLLRKRQEDLPAANHRQVP
eukprot:2340523-Alexandrium_andersonii.AAC.1